MPAIEQKNTTISRLRNKQKIVSQFILAFYLLSPNVLLADALISVATENGPTLEVSANGTQIVNINKPSAAGVSRNDYNAFNVGIDGLILNNSSGITNTQLAGQIDGNSNLSSNSASVILNEVLGGSATQLNGYTEIAGQSAEVVIANQSGITCNGCGFINTTRSTLTTGQLQFNNENFTGYSVKQGSVQIGDNGLNATNVEQVDILARSIELNGKLWSQHLNIITGANQISSDLTAISPNQPLSSAPIFALDVSSLGGMYADRIRLIGTEQGLGVNFDGDVIATENLQINVDGKLTNNATLASDSVYITSSELTNSQSATLLSANGGSHLTVSNTLDNKGVIKGQAISISADALINTGSTAQLAASKQININAQTINNSNSAIIASTEAINLIATGNIDNNDGHIEADQSLQIKAENLINSGEVISQDKLIIDAVATIANNQGGVLYGQNGLQITSKDLSNSNATFQSNNDIQINTENFWNAAQGLIYSEAGNIHIVAQTILNQAMISAQNIGLEANDVQNAGAQAQIQASQNVVVVAQTKVENTVDALLVGLNKIDITSQGTLDNSGTIYTQGTAQLSSNATKNNGVITSKNGELNIVGEELNNAGTIKAQNISIEVATLLNSGDNAQIQANQALEIKTTHDLINDNGAKLTSLETITLLISGALNNTGAYIQSLLGISIDADTITNTQGSIHAQAGDLAFVSNQIDNTGLIAGVNTSIQSASLNNSGESAKIQASEKLTLVANNGNIINQDGAVLYGQAGVEITATEAIANTNSIIQSSQALSLTAETVNNASNASIIAKTGNLNIDASSLNNQSAIAANGIEIVVDEFSNTGSNAKIQSSTDIIVTSQSDITNTDGAIIYGANNVALNSANNLNNSGLVQAGHAVALNARALSNTQGTIYAQTGDLNLVTDSLNNSGVLAGNNASITTKTFSNIGDTAKIQAQKELNISVTEGDLSNTDGAMLSSLETITLLISGALNNAESYIQSLLGLSIDADSITNAQGRIHAQTGDLLLTGNQIENSGLVAGVNTNIQSASLNNSGESAKIQASEKLTLVANNGNISNKNGAVLYGQAGVEITATETIENSNSIIQSSQAISLTAETVNNVSNASIIAKTGNLNIDASSLDNQSAIAANGIEILVDEFSNTGSNAKIQSSTDIIVTSQMDITNTNGAIIYSQNNIALNSANNLNNSGLVQAGNAVSLNAEVINNTQGTVLAQTGDLMVISNDLNNTGVLAGNNATITVKTFINTGDAAKIQTQKDLTISVTESDLNNTDGATIFSLENMVLAIWGGVKNTGAYIQSALGMAVSADSVVNDSEAVIAAQGELTITVSDIQNQGLIQGGDTIITTDTFTHSGAAAQLQAKDDLTLRVNSDDIINQGVMYAGNDLELNAGLNNISNQAIIQTGGDTTINAKAFNNTNTSTVLSEVGTLKIDVTEFTNTGTLAASKIDIDSAEFNNTGSDALIQAGDALDINVTAGDIVNQGGATLFGLNSIILTTAQAVKNIGGYIQSALATTITALSFENDKDALLLSETGALIVNVDSLTNAGSLVANDITLTVNEFSNDGDAAQIQANNDLGIIVSESDLTNTNGAVLYAGNDAVLTSVSSAHNIVNDAAIIQTGNTLTITGSALENNNNAVIATNNGLLAIQVSEFNNTSLIAGDSVSIATDTFNNVGTSAQLQSKKSITVTAKNDINNLAGALIYSGTDTQLETNKNVNNLSSRIESGSNLSVSAAKIVNEQVTFEVSNEELSSIDVSRESISVPYGYNYGYRDYTEKLMSHNVIENSAASYLVSGDNMSITGNLTNAYSIISAGENFDFVGEAFNNYSFDPRDTIERSGQNTLVDITRRCRFGRCSNEYEYTYEDYEQDYVDPNDTTETSLDSMAVIQIGGDANISATSIDNSYGSILSAQNGLLKIIDNETFNNEGITSANQIDITTDRFYNWGSGAQLQAGNSIVVKSNNQFYNSNGAIIYSGGDADLQVDNYLYNLSSVIETHGNLKLTGTNVFNQQYRNNDLRIVGGDSQIYSNGNISITGNLKNESSSIISKANLTQDQGYFYNDVNGVVKAKTGTATFGSAEFNTSNWTNNGFVGTDVLNVTAAAITNQGDKALVLTGSSLNMKTTSGDLNNTGGAVLYSFGDAQFDVFGTLLNESSNIETKRNLVVDANDITNKRESFVISVDEQITGTEKDKSIDYADLPNPPGGFWYAKVSYVETTLTPEVSYEGVAGQIFSDGWMKLAADVKITNEYSIISSSGDMSITSQKLDNLDRVEDIVVTREGKYEIGTWTKCGSHEFCDHKNRATSYRDFSTSTSTELTLISATISSGGTITGSVNNLTNGELEDLDSDTATSIKDRSDEEVIVTDPNSQLASADVKVEDVTTADVNDVTLNETKAKAEETAIAKAKLDDAESVGDVEVTEVAEIEEDVIDDATPVEDQLALDDSAPASDVADNDLQLDDGTAVEVTDTEITPIDPSELSVDFSDKNLDDLSNGALFSQTNNTDHNYLIETNPHFTEYENFISSDYMLEKMGVDINEGETTRLGDGYFEQDLVRDQILDLTGTQYLDDNQNTQDQYLDLMNNGIDAQQDLELAVGVALTAEQIQNLNKPIVWMVEQEFETENGIQTALVPQVYFTDAMQMLLREDGALISADNVDFKVANTATNSGTIKAKEKLKLVAENIGNSGKLAAVKQIDLIATKDIINQSGLIDGGKVTINAGRDFINETKVEYIQFGGKEDYSATQTLVSDIATINATDLTIIAGNDVKLIGSDIQVEDNFVVQAANNIEITTSKIIEEAINGNFYDVSSTEHITTEIGAGTVLMLAGGSFTSEAANIESSGDITVSAADINLLAVKNIQEKDVFYNYGGGNTQRTQSHSEVVVGTQLNSTGVLRLISENDIISRGSLLTGTDGITLNADGNILLATETAFNSNRVDTTSKKSGALGSTRKTSTSINESLTHTGTSLTSDGNIVMSSGNDISIIGSDVNAGQHIGIDAAGDLLVAAAVNQSFDQYTKTKKGSLTVSSKNIGSKTQEAVASNLNAGGSMSINSGGNVSVVGSNLAATDTLTIGNQIIAKNEDGQTLQNEQSQYVNQQGEQVGNVTVTTQELTNESWSESSSGLRGPAKDLVKGISVLTGTMTSTMGLDMEIEVGRSTTDRSTQTTQQASTVSANNLGIDVKGNVAIIGSDVNVGNIASINANSLTLDAAKETSTTHHSETVETISNSGPSLGENEITVGSIASTKTTDSTTTTETTWSGSTLNAGTLSVNTKENVNLVSSDINVAGDTTIKAKDILIGGRQDTTETLTENKEVIETVSLGIKNAYADTVLAIDALNDAKNSLRDAEQAYGDAKQKIANGEMPASELQYFEANMVAATANAANATLAVASAGATAAGTTGTAGFYATGTASVETNESSSTTTDKTWNGSNLNIGGNANLQAENEIQVKGSNIAVTGGLQLDAKNINLLAGENSSTSNSDSSSHTESASYSTASGPSGSLSANKTESSSESNYYTNTQIVAGTLSSDSENLTVSGANVDAGVVDITTENLLVESLQNTSSSNSQTQGANIGIGGNGLPSSGGINQQESESSSAWVDQQSGITGGNVSIKAKDTTLKGGLIAAVDQDGNDTGNLNFQTDTLTVEDIQDHDTSSDKGFSLNTGSGSTTVGANYSGHDKQQTTKATLGNGDVTVGGEDIADTGISVNRDVSNSQEVTQDHELGGLDAEVTVDHRVFTDDGIKSIKKDFVDTTQHAKEIGQAVEDIATTDIGLIDGIKNVDKYATDRKVLAQKAMDEKAQAALKGEKGAQGSEDELQKLSDELSKEEGLAENTDINLYDGSQTPDDTPVESANDFNKQEALAGYHENGEDGGNDVYLNIDKTDMTDSSDVVKSLVHEQERHSQAQNDSSLSATDQTTLATNRGEQAQDTFNAYSDLAGIETKSTTTQKDWNNTNRSSENVVKATEQMQERVNSEEVKPALPALAIPVIAASPEAVTAVAALATAVGLEIAEDDIKEFFGIEDTGVTVLETPIVETNPGDTHTGGDQVVVQDNQSYTTPVYDDPVDQLLENIPEGLGSNSTELPRQDDLGLGLVFSEEQSKEASIGKGKEVSIHPYAGGGSHLTTTDKLNNYPDSPTYGGPDGLYLAPEKQISELLKNSNTRAEMEVKLGLEGGSLEGGELIRIDVPDAIDRNLRLPDPKTGNIHHRPNTGRTTGDLIESVVDSPLKSDTTIKVSRPKIEGVSLNE